MATQVYTSVKKEKKERERERENERKRGIGGKKRYRVQWRRTLDSETVWLQTGSVINYAHPGLLISVGFCYSPVRASDSLTLMHRVFTSSFFSGLAPFVSPFFSFFFFFSSFFLSSAGRPRFPRSSRFDYLQKNACPRFDGRSNVFVR